MALHIEGQWINCSAETREVGTGLAPLCPFTGTSSAQTPDCKEDKYICKQQKGMKNNHAYVTKPPQNPSTVGFEELPGWWTPRCWEAGVPSRLQKGESPRLGVRPALWMELLTSKAVKLRKKGGVTALEIGFELVSAGCTHPETHM